MGNRFDEDIEKSTEEYKKHVKLLPWAVATMVLLGFLLVIRLPNDNNTVFTAVSFYQGDSHNEVDGRKLYERYYTPNFGENACTPSLVTGSNIKMMKSNVYWIIDDDERVANTTDPKDFAKLLGTAGVDYGYKPYSDGQFIIAPVSVTFLNSNVHQSTAGRIDIECLCGTKYKLVFEDVYCWWCHIGNKTDVTKHTQVLGYGGDKTMANGGRVLGQAKSSTIVRMYYKNDSDIWEPFDFKRYLTLDF